MKTGNVLNAQPHHNQHHYNNAVNSGKGKENKPNTETFANPVDKYTPNFELEGIANPTEVKRLWDETNHAAEAIRKLVTSMIGKGDASGQGFWAVRARSQFKLSEADRAAAQEMISEDGFFGVKQTTDRIMSFAKALVGENASPKQIENMRAAVQQGFDEVAKMFGGFDKLPQVSKDTYAAIMEAFDAWLPAEFTAEPTVAA